MRRLLLDLVLLFLLPLLMFWPQTVGGRTLLPTENLYQYEPYATYREVVKAPAIPHNHLLSDLVLQNMQWKLFTRQQIAEGEIPLWNPYQFSGIPFLAAGQQSILYPFSLLYYVLPIAAAYGWFTVVQLWLAGAFMYAFLRGLGRGRLGALVSGVTYQLSAFFVINAVFPMIMAAAVWLPLLLLMIEYVIRQRPLLRRPSSVPWVMIGAVALGCNIFAGHPEITYYTLLIMGYYAAARLVLRWRQDALRHLAARAAWLVTMVALGIGLGAAQFLPLFEFASVNWRSERGSIDTVLSYAHPPRDVLQFALPNFYGSPAHHTYFDWFTLQTVPVTVNAHGEPITHTEWGMKNYVEGALYVGILPLALAAFALLTYRRPVGAQHAAPLQQPVILIFALLTLVALTFMFGLPTYRLIYLLPGINQLNTAFRWIFAVTLGVAVLAGFGADALLKADRAGRRFGMVLMIAGGVILGGLLLSRLLYPQLEPLVERVMNSMATPDGRTAASRFADAAMFYSYQFTHVLIFGLFTLGAGIVFWWAGRDRAGAGRGATRAQHVAPLQSTAIILLIAADLMIASWGFNPASDPLLLDFKPPAIEWLQAQPGHWRYTTLQDPAQPPLFNANMTWQYGLRDVRGYESIIPAWYVDYMRDLAPQPQLDFNRVAPLYTDQIEQVDWVRLTLLGVRYIVTPRSMNLYDYLPIPHDPRDGRELPIPEPLYEDEAVRIWGSYDLPYAYVALVLEGRTLSIEDGVLTGWDVTIEGDTGREKTLHANVSDDVPEAWLVVSETYMPGWRAYVRPRGGDTDRPLEVEQVLGVFQGMNVSRDVLAAAFADVYDSLPPEQRAALDAGQITVRMVYSPQSFQLGFFGSFISGVLLLFMGGVWLWRRYVAPESDDSGTVKRVARNSLAPILLNLFNRGIDFAFAAVMLRVLGPADAGLYQYAIVIFVWFDIFTNFGLNTFLTREVARDRSRAGYYFWNTSALRLILIVVGVLPLVAFIGARQGLVTPALDSTALLALGLLYIGLLPNSLSTGMTALFYAFEKAEYPSAVSTIATLNKAVFGVLVLVLGYGIVGLAAVSIITNLLTLAVLMYGGRGLLRPHPKSLSHEGRGTSDITSPDETSGTTAGSFGARVNPALMRGMVGESWPLMINHFLATIFFQIDVVLIEFMRGARMVGLYSVAYKWVAAINVIPAFFTMAMLPVMSRQAQEDRAALKRTFTLAIKLLLSVALPTAVFFTFFAHDLTRLLGGAEFLPDGAIATQLMIWSIPFGWVNSLTQYVLIALDLQRRITRAFIVAVTFNIVTNLLLIPQFGYQAAALTTIASEIMLLIPFGLLLTRALGPLNWLDMAWRQVVAVVLMVLLMGMVWDLSSLGALVLGVLAYCLALLALKPFANEEIERLIPLLPGRLRPASLRLLSR